MAGFWAAVWRVIAGSGAGQDEADEGEAKPAPRRRKRKRQPKRRREPEPSDDDVVVMPIEDAIDLHTFQPREIVSVVDEYLREARRMRFREVRVIHGRGKGVQRARVRSLLKNHPAVESFRSAPHTRGGWGATLVVLKPLGGGARSDEPDLGAPGSEQ